MTGCMMNQITRNSARTSLCHLMPFNRRCAGCSRLRLMLVSELDRTCWVKNIVQLEAVAPSNGTYEGLRGATAIDTYCSLPRLDVRENVCRCKESSGAYDLHFSVAPLFATHDDPCLILAVLLAFDDRSAAQFWKFKSISLILGKFVAVIRICFLRCRHSYLVTCIWALVSLDGISGGKLRKKIPLSPFSSWSLKLMLMLMIIIMIMIIYHRSLIIIIITIMYDYHYHHYWEVHATCCFLSIYSFLFTCQAQ